MQPVTGGRGWLLHRLAGLGMGLQEFACLASEEAAFSLDRERELIERDTLPPPSGNQVIGNEEADL